MICISSKRSLVVLIGMLMGCSAAMAQADKLGIYAQMRAIAAEQASLRGNTEQQNRYIELQTQFDALKRSMGGDDPTRMYEANSIASISAGKSAKAAPAGPPGLVITQNTFIDNVALPIPTGPGVVSATIAVSGAGIYLWDVDVTTNLSHTFSADLDVTITSPTGTVVTLTSDNGAGNDNVFAGTVWDDQANPSGQVPYTTNNGLVTDQVYVNLTAATPLVPEEALGAFRGEDPNGTWTITISDDLAGDGGSLNSWSLDVFSAPQAPIETSFPFTDTTVVAIPTGPGVVTSTLLISGAGTSLTNVDLTTLIDHTFSADLDFTLQSPAGTIVTLSTDNGAGNDNVFAGTSWTDSANAAGQVPYVNNNGLVTDQTYVNLTLASPLVPEESMSAFLGEDPNGTWTLSISDDLAGDGGNLNGWSLNITTGLGLSPPIFDYAPAPLGTVNFPGGAIGASSNASVTVSINTAGFGTGAGATTTTTCTAPTAPFSGFGQSVTAEGAGAISGGPLSGSCVLGAAATMQTLTCSENQGGTPVLRTFELLCPAGTAQPLTSTPASGSLITLPTQTLGGVATMAPINFQNPGVAVAAVTCTNPVATQFTVSPLMFNVPAGGNAGTVVSYSSAAAGTFTGQLVCTSGGQTFTFDLSGTTGIARGIPAMGGWSRILLMLSVLVAGIAGFGLAGRRD